VTRSEKETRNFEKAPKSAQEEREKKERKKEKERERKRKKENLKERMRFTVAVCLLAVLMMVVRAEGDARPSSSSCPPGKPFVNVSTHLLPSCRSHFLSLSLTFSHFLSLTFSLFS
jgi:hypothetical protein